MDDAQHALSRVALLLRVGLGTIWLWSAVVSEFIAPREVSLGLLAAIGIAGDLATLLLHAASLLSAFIGTLTLLGLFTRSIAIVQAALIALYSLLLVGHVPELWAHPFAPLGKNITLIAAALSLGITGGGKWSLDQWQVTRGK